MVYFSKTLPWKYDSSIGYVIHDPKSPSTFLNVVMSCFWWYNASHFSHFFLFSLARHQLFQINSPFLIHYNGLHIINTHGTVQVFVTLQEEYHCGNVRWLIKECHWHAFVSLIKIWISAAAKHHTHLHVLQEGAKN